MKNEIQVIESVEKRLMKKSEPRVFPLTPTHRKELRNLRDENIGSLRERLNTIRTLKRDEFIKKYELSIKKSVNERLNICDKLNHNWNLCLIKIHTIIKTRKEFEKKIINKKLYLNLEKDYNNLSQLKALNNTKRKYYINDTDLKHSLGSDLFHKKYGGAFNEVQKRIDDLTTKYEEAINFGDLDIVKELYYIMKSADSFFIKIDALKI